MTLVNVAIDDGRAVIVADELSYVDGEASGLRNKIATNDMANVAVAVRGECLLGDAIFDIVATARRADEAVARIDLAFDHLRDIGTLEELDFEVFLVGVNPENGVAGGRAWCRGLKDGDSLSSWGLEPGVWLQPVLGTRAVPPGITDDQHFRIALAQQKLSISHDLNMCIGGSVHLVEVTRDGIACRCLGDFPDRAMTEKRVARYQRQRLRRASAGSAERVTA